ncbi:MAG TPA: proton-conducting transporter membrane subunit [Candidatus Dormibacteraeota bacterium]
MGSSFGPALVASLLPEILLLALAAVCAILGAIRRERPDLHRWIAVIGLLGAITSTAYTLHATSRGSGTALTVWGGGLLVDRFSLYVTVLVCAFALITCLTSDGYLRRIPTRAPAFFALLLLVTAALIALAAEREMATMFITLEVVIIGITAMQALVKTDDRAAEAAWKLLVEGAVASALLFYGMAILYTVAGSTSLSVVGAAAARAPAASALGIALVLLGLTLPLGVAPLRAWVSRAGQAVPATAAGFSIVAGVAAGSVAWLRFGVSGLGGGVGTWLGLTAGLAALALLSAALLAVREDRVTGLAGAVMSGQAGLLLLALISTGQGASSKPAQGATAFLFALGVFGVSALGTFAMLAILEAARLPDTIGDYRGLGRRSPTAALLLAVALVGLIGAPPAAGFLARILLLESSVDAGYGWVAAAAAAAIVVLAVPVVRLVASMYADPGPDAPFTMAASPMLTRVVAGACCAAGVLATVLAQPLLLLAQGAAGPIH